jgi:tetratricopeptide (TPR) repeat protein
MRKIIVSVFLVLTFICSQAMSETITVKHTVKQTFGGSQFPDDARISAMAKAKREALEMAGTYIESLTVVQNSKVEKDEILALTAGVLKAEVVSQKNYASDDAFGIEIIVNVVVDTSVLEERVKKLLQDKTHLTQLKDTQKREKELLQRVAQLEEENRKLTAEKQSSQKLKKEFQQASDGLTAVDWFNKAEALWDGKKYTDPKKAIEYLNNAIKLQPDLSEAFYNRGSAYARDLGQYQRAIEDYNEAIRLKPDYADTYNNRGSAYNTLGQYQRAIEDYNEVIRLKPDYTNAYINRGHAYDNLGQYQRAITDYNEAIRLKPDYANAYNNRGIAYLSQGNKKLGCHDAKKACKLGTCKVLDIAKDEGLCR